MFTIFKYSKAEEDPSYIYAKMTSTTTTPTTTTVTSTTLTTQDHDNDSTGGDDYFPKRSLFCIGQLFLLQVSS